jgi:hypothetical protein
MSVIARTQRSAAVELRREGASGGRKIKGGEQGGGRGAL